jgi:hypothetical protein
MKQELGPGDGGAKELGSGEPTQTESAEQGTSSSS